MMRPLAFVTVLAVSLGLLAAGTLAAPTKYNLSDYLPLQTGDTWKWGKHRDGELVPDSTVVVKGEKSVGEQRLIVRESSDGEVEHFRRAAAGIEWYGGTTKSKIGPVPWHLEEPILLPNGLAVGEERTQSCPGTLGPKLPCPKMSRTLKFTLKLEGVEDVKVPAGKFARCLKVTMSFDAGTILGTDTRITRTAWFAKGVGEVKVVNTEAGKKPHAHPLLEASIGGKKYAAK